mmetsp:Transcript_15429/g.27019  ORF Transcript_15429/g.27019 Transcript_15429/m.27019 type:complete len:281 (+) Transcript_15429:229-1071(+)
MLRSAFASIKALAPCSTLRSAAIIKAVSPCAFFASIAHLLSNKSCKASNLQEGESITIINTVPGRAVNVVSALASTSSFRMAALPRNAAGNIAVRPVSSARLGSAPAFRRVSTISILFFSAARSNEHFLCFVVALGLAFFSKSKFTVCRSFRVTAFMRGVCPSRLGTSGSAPAARYMSTNSWFPPAIANISGLSSSESAFMMSALSPMSARTISTLPSMVALMRGVSPLGSSAMSTLPLNSVSMSFRTSASLPRSICLKSSFSNPGSSDFSGAAMEGWEK